MGGWGGHPLPPSLKITPVPVPAWTPLAPGELSRHLVQYFTGIPGVPPHNGRQNPATWMLNVLAVEGCRPPLLAGLGRVEHGEGVRGGCTGCWRGCPSPIVDRREP